VKKRRNDKSPTALEQALAIVSEARDTSIDIDWTHEPKSDRERDLRLAIIRRIEVEMETEGFDARGHEMKKLEARMFNLPEPVKDEVTGVASDTHRALKDLLDDAEISGSDLYHAPERWEAAAEAERTRNKKVQARRLVDKARLDVAP